MKVQIYFWAFLSVLFFNQNGYAEVAQRLNDKARIMMNNNLAHPSKFIVFGDTELDAVHDNMLEDIKNRYTSNDLAFLVIVGDLFPAGLDKAEAFSIYDQKIRSWMDETGIAVWTVPGNHDMECHECDDLYTALIGDINWMFEYNGSAFVGVLNAQVIPGYVGPGWSNEVEAFGVTQATTESVETFLSASSYDNLFNFTHVPLIWANYACGYEGYLEYYSMLVRNGLTANFAGHIHLYQKDFQCNTGAYEIVTGAGGARIVGGGNSANQYKSSQAYCDISFNNGQVPQLELYTSDNTSNNSTYSLNSPYTFYMDKSEASDCGDCAKWPLYNDQVKPLINLVERNGTCYTCIQNLTGIYDDLRIWMNDEIVTQSVNLGNGQLCFQIEEPTCESKVEVEYISCASKDSDCGTTSVTFDPNDLQTTIEDMILEISECHDGTESSMPYVLLQANNALTLTSHIISVGSELATTQEELPHNQVLITWDGYLAKDLVVDVSYEYCGCLIEDEIRIPIPSCTNGNCCPAGSGFDGANCYFNVYVPEGYDPFIWNNSFYTHYGPEGPGDCPPDAFDNGAGCYFNVGFPSEYEGFIWNNRFYTHENCEANPALCCPAGTTWDGSNCRYDITVPSGHTPFISLDNELYLSPDKDGECPLGTTPTIVGCSLGVTIPEGLDGFVYNGAFYVHENCAVDQCCPEGTTWNGETCEMQLIWGGTTIIVLEDNSIVLEPDLDGGCPEGSTLDEKGEYCLTGLAVPSGFEGQVNGKVIELEPNCKSCCPEGLEFDGENCVKKINLAEIDIHIVEGQIAVIPDCLLFPQNRNCCPEGFYFSEGNCLLKESTEELGINFMWPNLSLERPALNCLELQNKTLAKRKAQPVLQEQQSDDTIIIYPNPAQSIINIEIGNNDSRSYTVELLDCLGKVLASQYFERKMELNISSFSSGLHFVKIMDENKRLVRTEKLMIVK